MSKTGLGNKLSLSKINFEVLQFENAVNVLVYVKFNQLETATILNFHYLLSSTKKDDDKVYLTENFFKAINHYFVKEVEAKKLKKDPLEIVLNDEQKKQRQQAAEYFVKLAISQDKNLLKYKYLVNTELTNFLNK